MNTPVKLIFNRIVRVLAAVILLYPFGCSGKEKPAEEKNAYIKLVATRAFYKRHFLKLYPFSPVRAEEKAEKEFARFRRRQLISKRKLSRLSEKYRHVLNKRENREYYFKIFGSLQREFAGKRQNS